MNEAHREQTLKIVGSVGIAGTLGALVLLIVAHVVVGAGAILGVGAMLAATDGSAPTDLSFVTLIERMHGLWGYLAAWLLWRGYIQSSPRVAA